MLPRPDTLSKKDFSNDWDNNNERADTGMMIPILLEYVSAEKKSK